MKKVTKNLKGKTMHVMYTGLAHKGVVTGGDQLFIDIAPRLPKELKLIIIMPHFAKDYWKDVDQSNIEFKLLAPNRFELKSNPVLIFLSYMVRVWQVYWLLKKEDVQTIYSSSDIAYADIWPAYWAVGRNPKIKWLSRIYHVILPPNERQGNYFVNVVAFRLQRLSFWMMKRRSSTIFALNDKLYKEVLTLGFPKKKLEILGAGIDYKTINAFKPKKKYQYDVVALGRIAPVKGIFDAVKAWEKVHEAFPKAKLAWVGGGSDNHRKKMIEQIKAGGLQKSFSMLGFMKKEEVYGVLKSAKVFLCPDHENGWGLAVCEGMSCGLPVVSYDLDIFGGVYKKGYKSAKLFDTAGLADAIIDLLSDEKERKKVAADALAQAREFDHQKVVNELVKYL